MKTFGNKHKVAIELGSYWEGSKQHQDIKTWVGNKLINDIDSIVYLPTYYNKLKEEIEKLKSNSFHNPHFIEKKDHEIFQIIKNNGLSLYEILCYDLTTCSANCYFINDKNHERIIFSFWDKRHEPNEEVNKVFFVNVNKKHLLSTLESVHNSISTTWY